MPPSKQHHDDMATLSRPLFLSEFIFGVRVVCLRRNLEQRIPIFASADTASDKLLPAETQPSKADWVIP